jgi:hypothetical protein
MTYKIFTTNEGTLISSQATTGVGTSVDISNGDITFIIKTSTDFNGTIKWRGSAQSDVDLTAANSLANSWEYISIVPANEGSAETGTAGIVIGATGTVITKIVGLNYDNPLKFIAPEVTTRNAGSVSVSYILSNK